MNWQGTSRAGAGGLVGRLENDTGCDEVRMYSQRFGRFSSVIALGTMESRRVSAREGRMSASNLVVILREGGPVQRMLEETTRHIGSGAHHRPALPCRHCRTESPPRSAHSPFTPAATSTIQRSPFAGHGVPSFALPTLLQACPAERCQCLWIWRTLRLHPSRSSQHTRHRVGR